MNPDQRSWGEPIRSAVARSLSFYSAIVSTLILTGLLLGARPTGKRSFDEITVHRLNVVEPDGTLRMVVADKARLPPVIVKGRLRPELGEARPQAGMLFYNDEGTETGGLIFSGRRDASGRILDSGVSLSFDKYGARQLVQLAGVDDSEARFAGLGINGDHGQRVWVGHEGDGDASVVISGADGKPRLRLQVTPAGGSSIVFLDAKGHTLRRLGAEGVKGS